MLGIMDNLTVHVPAEGAVCVNVAPNTGIVSYYTIVQPSVSPASPGQDDRGDSETRTSSRRSSTSSSSSSTRSNNRQLKHQPVPPDAVYSPYSSNSSSKASLVAKSNNNDVTVAPPERHYDDANDEDFSCADSWCCTCCISSNKGNAESEIGFRREYWVEPAWCFVFMLGYEVFIRLVKRSFGIMYGVCTKTRET